MDTYDQVVAHLEKKLELSGFENDGEIPKHILTAGPPHDKSH